MPLPLAIGIFFVMWWTTLFVVLPFGVKTQEEEQSVVPGSSESAPSAPKLAHKLLATTLITCILFALVYWLITASIVTLDNIPFLPRF